MLRLQAGYNELGSICVQCKRDVKGGDLGGKICGWKSVLGDGVARDEFDKITELRQEVLLTIVNNNFRIRKFGSQHS